jgi:hypothetical protein
MVLEEAQPAAILEDGVAHGRQLHRGVGRHERESAAGWRQAAAAAASSVVAAAPAAIHPRTVAGACRIHSTKPLTSEFMFQTSNFMLCEAAGLSRGLLVAPRDTRRCQQRKLRFSLHADAPRFIGGQFLPINTTRWSRLLPLFCRLIQTPFGCYKSKQGIEKRTRA